MTKIKIQIKSRWTGSILFEFKNAGNTFKGTLIEAVKNKTDLAGADLHGAFLRGAEGIPYVPLACPSDGAFIGWKKVDRYLVKLEIPEDAERSSATTNICRCDKAKVLDIICTSDDNPLKPQEITNFHYTKTIYKVGEMVYADSFDPDRWNENSHGIHFFINKQDAINY